MIGFKVDKARDLFVDRRAVREVMDRRTLAVFGRFGAFVRKVAQRSIRRRKRPSQPGSPPSSHSGELRRFLYFAVDTRRRSVVIGPAATNQTFFDDDMRPVRGTVPEVLEYGGAITIVEEWTGSRWRRRDLRTQGAVSDVDALRHSDRSNIFRGRPIRKRRVNIQRRPYMGPAFAIGQRELAGMWQDSIAA